jgi:Phage tail protein
LASTTVTGFSTADTTATNVDYTGTVDTGMVFVVNAAHNISDVTIYQTTPGGDLYSMEFAGSLVPGDKLTISTVAGNKGAVLTRAGVDSSVLYGISPQSKWLQLEPGTNAIKVYATDAGSAASITYTKRYGGL